MAESKSKVDRCSLPEGSGGRQSQSDCKTDSGHAANVDRCSPPVGGGGQAGTLPSSGARAAAGGRTTGKCKSKKPRKERWRRVARHPGIYKVGNVFYVKVSVGGRRETIACGPRFSDARDMLANRLAERRHARLAKGGMASDDFPLRSLWERYVVHCDEMLPAATVQGYREAGARWRKCLAADLLVSGLTADHVARMRAWARGRGLSLRSMELTLTVLKAALSFGVANGVTRTNPIRHVPVRRRVDDGGERSVRVFSEEEVGRLLAHDHPNGGDRRSQDDRSTSSGHTADRCSPQSGGGRSDAGTLRSSGSQSSGPPDSSRVSYTRPCESRALWMVLNGFGLRVLELVHLLRRDVCLERRVVEVRSTAGRCRECGLVLPPAVSGKTCPGCGGGAVVWGHKLKTKRSSRDLHIVDDGLFDALWIQMAAVPGGPDDLVFPTRNGLVMSRGNLRKRLRGCLAACGIDGAGRTPRSWRHTAITRWVRAEIPPKQIQALAGWASLRMLDRYEHLDSRDNLATQRRIEAAKGRLAGGGEEDAQ